ncbi:cerebrin prohormone preproprotein [Aplysia californica]|uniref:Cerebrin prohormone n=2 Tax=Aplysia TaxID=6499 RepID=CBPH_APLCA|nr:cerebrin prohormone preproprotein [Aplysia californica]Q8T112.1 RecName: Full=Cerebrin prohormone; Contains: RecName: Full=Cerebrin; Flags: Precursor [Aplysia californica]AAM00268.1 cerebrin prohormone [Aplysia californica]
MFGYRSLLVLLVTLSLCLLLQSSHCSAVRTYGNDLDARARREIISLAARLIKLSMYGPEDDSFVKRNGGTADALYNLPDLEKIGKR